MGLEANKVTNTITNNLDNITHLCVHSREFWRPNVAITSAKTRRGVAVFLDKAKFNEFHNFEQIGRVCERKSALCVHINNILNYIIFPNIFR